MPRKRVLLLVIDAAVRGPIADMAKNANPMNERIGIPATLASPRSCLALPQRDQNTNDFPGDYKVKYESEWD